MATLAQVRYDIAPGTTRDMLLSTPPPWHALCDSASCVLMEPQPSGAEPCRTVASCWLCFFVGVAVGAVTGHLVTKKQERQERR